MTEPGESLEQGMYLKPTAGPPEWRLEVHLERKIRFEWHGELFELHATDDEERRVLSTLFSDLARALEVSSA